MQLSRAHAASPRRRIEALQWAAFGLGVSIVVVLHALQGNSRQTHVLGAGFEVASLVLGLWLSLIIFWWAQHRRKLDLFELPVWFSLNAYVQVVANVWWFQRNVIPTSPLVKGRYASLAVPVVLLMGIGLTAMWIGYVLSQKLLVRQSRTLVPKQVELRLGRTYGVWLVASLISTMSVVMGFQGYLAVSGDIGQNYLLFVTLLANLATFSLMLHHFRRPTPVGRVWLLFACGSTLLLGLLVGTRGAAFILLYALMAKFYASGRLSWRWVLTGVVVLVVAAPTATLFRTNLFRSGYSRTAGAPIMDRVNILAGSWEEIVTQSPSALLGQTRDVFKGRQGSIFELTAAVLAAHPSSMPFQGFEFARQFAVWAVPRFLWPGKPSGRPDLYMVSTTYMGSPSEQSFAALGQFADAYRVAGWPFVVFWFLSLGCLSALVYSRGPGRGSLPGTAFYLVLLIGVLNFNNDLFGTALRLVQMVPLLWIIQKFVMTRRLLRPVRESAGPGEASP
jgi:hypothetical protein